MSRDADATSGQPPETVPEDVRRFVLTSIPSVPFLEALLIFRGSAAPLRVRTLAERLYTSEERAEELVAQLRASRLVQPGSDGIDFRFAPATAELARLIDRLAQAYAAHLLDITRLIHSNTERKAHQFADAFKLRKN